MRNGRLRGHDQDGRCYCPITAVLKHHKDVFVPPLYVDDAAGQLKLWRGTSTAIIAAADDQPYSAPALRTTLLDVTNARFLEAQDD